MDANETIGICQFCKCTFDPECYFVVEGSMTLPERSMTFYTICPDCTDKTDIWDGENTIIPKQQ